MPFSIKDIFQSITSVEIGRDGKETTEKSKNSIGLMGRLRADHSLRSDFLWRANMGPHTTACSSG